MQKYVWKPITRDEYRELFRLGVPVWAGWDSSRVPDESDAPDTGDLTELTTTKFYVGEAYEH